MERFRCTGSTISTTFTMTSILGVLDHRPKIDTNPIKCPKSDAFRDPTSRNETASFAPKRAIYTFIDTNETPDLQPRLAGCQWTALGIDGRGYPLIKCHTKSGPKPRMPYEKWSKTKRRAATPIDRERLSLCDDPTEFLFAFGSIDRPLENDLTSLDDVHSIHVVREVVDVGFRQQHR